MKFGDNLKNIRKYKKISQEELSEKLGVSRQSISKWETGENYPSMTNIMCLCDIFNCKINELVHEDMTDIDSLDEEIKMSVVKFKKDEQKKMKGISKFIYVFSKICKIISKVFLGVSIVTAVLLLTITINGKINNKDKKITLFGKEYTYVLDENEFSVNYDDDKLVVAENFTIQELNTFNKFLYLSKGSQLVIVTLFAGTLVCSLVVVIKLMGYLEKLFRNIHDNDTPFNMDNVFYIKKLAIYLLLYLLLSDVSGSIVEGIFTLNLNIEIELGQYIIALVVLAISYVFKYGYEIQLDSKGKIYGEINE